VTEDGALEAIKSLIDAMEQQSGLSRELLNVAKAQAERLGELEENYADLMLEVGRLTRRARLLVNMKASTLTMTCRKCGNEYAREAGPELCGPCWVELGRPERYLSPA
jgi:hypothetical protein